MNQSFLPLGSIVSLKGATRYVVVIGYTVVEEGEQKIWDYLGCAYPIGVVDPSKNLLFDQDQIEKVVFRGFTDLEGIRFLMKLNESVSKLKNG